ncbi:MAG: VanZ family protein [Phycisphaerales bacterium]|nr:VanZ family protein [Phycisphaerales bacterium]
MPSPKPWRVLFIIYLILIIAGTHWPQLAMGSEVHPPPDKLIHFLAFATAPILLVLTRWLPLIWVIVLSLLFAVTDEITQHYFAFGRVYNPLDMIASVLGVFIASIWILALRPIGHDPRGVCTARTIYQLNLLSWKPSFWWRFGPVVLLPFFLITIVVWMILWFGFNQSNMEIAVLSGTLYATWATYALVMKLVRHTPMTQCCFNCGTLCDSVTFNKQGHAQCPSCDTPLHAAQWDRLPLPVGLLRRAIPPSFAMAFVYTLAIIALSAGFCWAFAACYAHFLDRNFPWNRVFVSLDVVGIVTAICLLFGLTVWLTRSKIAAQLNKRQSSICVICAHQLEDSVADQGQGACPQCGTTFLVLPDSAPKHCTLS